MLLFVLLHHNTTVDLRNNKRAIPTILFLLDPPDLFSDDGTLTPDPMREDGTDESPLHMNNRNMQNMKGGIPTEKLKKIRINRKDFKKGGDGLRGKNVTEQFRVKDKDMKRTMK